MAEKVHEVEPDTPDTTHITIKNPETAQSDLAYLAKKLGLDIDKLREERIAKEHQEREIEKNARLEKKNRARQAAEAALDKEFINLYSQNYLLTINGKRLKQFKSFDDVKCFECGEALPAIRGYAQSIVEMGNKVLEHPYNPLSAFYLVPVRIDDAKCSQGHGNKVIIQRII